MILHVWGQMVLIVLVALSTCFNLSAGQHSCVESHVLSAEIGIKRETSDSKTLSRELFGMRFGIYDVEWFSRYRLYGLEVNAISVGGMREVYGLQCGFTSECSLGGGLIVGVCNFVSNYAGVELGILNVFNADDRQFMVQAVTGVQIGAINMNSSALALQIGSVNTQEVLRDGFAMEIGFANFVKTSDERGSAVQCGFWNWAEATFRDDFLFQIGIVNWLLYGYEQEFCVQVGLINMKKKNFDEGWGFIPFISVLM